MEETLPLDNRPVLVTGGAGFIGSHLTERLVELGADVTILDDLSSGTRDNITTIREDVEFVEGDVRKESTLNDVLKEDQIVFHLAANAHVPTSVNRPSYDFDVNAVGTQKLLNSARNRNVDGVVIASSAAVYGPPAEVPMSESHQLKPVSPYGASKLSAEKVGLSYSETYDIDVTALRIFNTYGPRQPRYVMYDFFDKLEQDPTELEIIGSGQQVRTFSYVSDTVEAFLAIAIDSNAPGEAYNIGGSKPLTISELAELMSNRYYDGQPDLHTTDVPKAGDIERLIPDNSKIEEIGVDVSVPIENGLDNLYKWFSTNYPVR